MQHIQEKIQLKSGCLRNVTIAGHKFKNIYVYECGGNCIRSLFKEYLDALPEDKVSIRFYILHDVVTLLTMRGESKS